MTTMEQSLANLVHRGQISYETALGCTSRPEQLEGLLERTGFVVPSADAAPLAHGALKLAGS
jgi:hypothetical protein